jgi:hypothetical protein
MWERQISEILLNAVPFAEMRSSHGTIDVVLQSRGVADTECRRAGFSVTERMLSHKSHAAPAGRP